MTIGFVATVLTVYGIETSVRNTKPEEVKLQQYLPFTVLKLMTYNFISYNLSKVATVLTVYGIETCTVRNHARTKH